MQDLSHEITNLNKFLSEKHHEITSSGDKQNKFIEQLFASYSSYPMQSFCIKIELEQVKHNKNIKIEPKDLINLAKETFLTLKLNKKWITEDPKIIALSTIMKSIN